MRKREKAICWRGYLKNDVRKYVKGAYNCLRDAGFCDKTARQEVRKAVDEIMRDLAKEVKP